VLAYITEDARKAVVMANRGRGGEESFIVRLPQLKSSAKYRIEIDGKPSVTKTGSNLATEGIKIQLDNYRASVISIQER